MSSPEERHSELRKSLDSIQSMLSNPSPMMATSLASRIHRASLESGLESGSGSGGAVAGDQSRYEGGGGGRGGSLGGGIEPSGSSGGAVSFQLASASASAAAGGPSSSSATVTSPLAPIAEPRGSSSSSSGSSGGHHHGHSLPSPRIMDSRDSLEGHGGNTALSPRLSGNRDSLSYTPFQQFEDAPPGGSGSASAFANVERDSGREHHHQQGQPPFRSPSSAFSTVNKKILSPNAIGGGVGGLPFSSSANTPSGNNSVMSGALGSVSSASRTGGQTLGSDSAHHHGRRETSLLVSPVSQHSSSRRSFRQSDAESVFGSHAATSDSPRGTLAAGSAEGATPSAASIRSSHSSQKVGPTGTPMVASKNSATPATAGLTIHTNLQPTTHGRDPTPYHHRSNHGNVSSSSINLSTSPPYSSNNTDISRKASDASSRIGRDPPAKSPFPTHINASGSGSSSSGRHHHAHIGSSSFGSTSNKGSSSGHSHHYQKDHQHHQNQQEENELSMIEEDDSIEDESLVSHVTGSTFVRTPNVGKHHGHNHTPKGNATATHHASGHSMAGNTHHGHHGHNRGAHLTPRSNTRSQAYATPGSTASTAALHATPMSTSDLLHRPSLAMRENLAHLATTTSHALEEIWDCVGVPPDERASQLADLVEKISQLCEEKVQSEDDMRMTFRKEIDKARKEWEETCAALKLDGEEDPVHKMRRDPSAKDLGSGSKNGGVSLQTEYEVMMGRLESLRSVKESAMADMQASQARIYEAFAALNGCTVEEAAWTTEMQPYAEFETNLTLHNREHFRTKAQEYEERVSERKKAIVSLLLDCQSVLRELDIVPEGNEASVGRSEDDVKIWNSLEPIDDDVHEDNPGQRRGQSNHYTTASLFESPTCIGISNSAMDRLTNRIAELNGEKKHRRVRLGEMGSAIAALWSMLRVPSEEQQAFTATIRGLGMDTLRKGEAEIARLEELKGVMIGKLVREQRSMIEELWEKTNSSAAERASFDDYYHIQDDEQLTSEVLHKHEEYVASLKSKLDKMQPILDLIAKREAIIEDRIELEFLQKDPDRLKGRGASKQLMKEERMARRVTMELPKITSMLERTLKQWFAENKPLEGGGHATNPELGHFMYKGSPYLETMHCQEEEWRTRKERGEQERQRKRQEERAAASSANAAFGYSNTYTKLPGKKWNPSTNADATGGAAAGARPRSASNMRSNSNMRSGSAMRSGGSHPVTSGNASSRSGSNMRFGGRGPLGDVSSSRQNTARPPSRPRGGPGGAGGMDRGKKAPAGAGRGYRPASAPRMRL